MTRRRWRPAQPESMQHAIRLCLDYALHKHRRSVARVAELIGTSEWAIYKWMHEGSIPGARIRPFEFATDATYITQYIALSAQKLVIDIPAGASSSREDLLDLQTQVNEAEAADVVQGVTLAMQKLAAHRENVRKHDAPELALFGGEG